jgi:hypothetical protein
LEPSKAVLVSRPQDAKGRFVKAQALLDTNTLRRLSALRIRLEPPHEQPLTILSTVHYALVPPDWWGHRDTSKEP